MLGNTYTVGTPAITLTRQTWTATNVTFKVAGDTPNALRSAEIAHSTSRGGKIERHKIEMREVIPNPSSTTGETGVIRDYRVIERPVYATLAQCEVLRTRLNDFCTQANIALVLNGDV